MRTSKPMIIPPHIKADMEAFRKWLGDNTTLNELSKTKYVWQIRKLHGSCNSKIDVNSIRTYLVHSGRNYMRKYALKAYIKYLGRHEWNMELETQYKGIRLMKRENSREMASFKTFRAFMDEVSPELKIILMALWDSTTRIGAVLSLETKNYGKDEAGTFMYVREKGNTHAKRYIHSQTARLLNDYIARNKAAIESRGGYVFIDKGETQEKAYYRFWTEFKNKSRKAHVQSPDFGISFHWLRTTRIIKYYKKYRDISKVQAIALHATPQTTLRYTADKAIEHSEILKEEGEIW